MMARRVYAMQDGAAKEQRTSSCTDSLAGSDCTASGNLFTCAAPAVTWEVGVGGGHQARLLQRREHLRVGGRGWVVVVVVVVVVGVAWGGVGYWTGSVEAWARAGRREVQARGPSLKEADREAGTTGPQGGGESRAAKGAHRPGAPHQLQHRHELGVPQGAQPAGGVKQRQVLAHEAAACGSGQGLGHGCLGESTPGASSWGAGRRSCAHPHTGTDWCREKAQRDGTAGEALT